MGSEMCIRDRFLAPTSGFFDDVSFSVLAVVRDPYDWLYARYQERVTGGWTFETRSFDAFVNSAVADGLVDYADFLDNFRLQLPEADVKVFSYEALEAKDVLLEEMLRVIGHVPATSRLVSRKRSNVSAKLGLGVEAIRRVSVFAACLDRDLRQLWRKNLLSIFTGLLSEAESARSSPLRRQTIANLEHRADYASSLLAASYLDSTTRQLQPIKLSEQWSKVEQQRLDELSDVALVELHKIIAAYPDRLQDPRYEFSLSIGDCLSALECRRELSARKVINVHADVATALVGATLSGKVIFLHDVGEHQARALLSFLDEVELPSPVIEGSFSPTGPR